MCFYQGSWPLILEFLHSALTVLKGGGVSGSKQLQIAFLGTSSHVLLSFCLLSTLKQMTQNSTNLKFASSSTMTWVRWSWSLQKRNIINQVNWIRWEREPNLCPWFPACSTAGLSNGAFRNDGNVLYLGCLLDTQHVACYPPDNWIFHFISLSLM